jgi:riboflavin kinase/FMN adenylyltransferase
MVPGKGIGSKKTVPRLNLVPANELLPAPGVYVTRTGDLDSGEQSNSGDRLPTSAFGHLLLYFVRDEKKFDTPELLRAQILKDVRFAMRFHARLRRDY